MAYIQLSQVLAPKDLKLNQRSEDIIAEQRFLGNLGRFVREDGSVLLHINSSDGYWNSIHGANILQVAFDKLIRYPDDSVLYGGSGFVRMYPDDSIEYWLSLEGPAFAIYYDPVQGMRVMDLGDFQAGQRPSQAV